MDSPAGYMLGPGGYIVDSPAGYMLGPVGYMVDGPAGYMLGPAGYMVAPKIMLSSPGTGGTLYSHFPGPVPVPVA